MTPGRETHSRATPTPTPNALRGEGSACMSMRAGVSAADLVVMVRALLATKQQQARGRMGAARKGAKVSHPSRALDEVGRAFGKSGRHIEKLLAIADAAEADPDRYGRLLAAVDAAAGRVGGPYTRLRRMQDEARVLDLAPRIGRFRTLLLDPPWDEDGLSPSGGHAYALMSAEAIAELPVADWADPDGTHLYLCCTNNTLALAVSLLPRWGFVYRTCHTWTKVHLGRGRYFRNTTEHVLFATLGELKTRPAAMAMRTDHAWPVPDGPESTKPEGLYDLVRGCSYGPYAEAFQRAPRPDFVNLFSAPAACLEAAE